MQPHGLLEASAASQAAGAGPLLTRATGFLVEGLGFRVL